VFGLRANKRCSLTVASWRQRHANSWMACSARSVPLDLLNVAQAEAIAKTIPGLKHVVLWRGLISLSRDIPNSDIDLLASRNRLLVRKDLHPALQYLLLEAMRKVPRLLGEFPAEQPNDLPLSPMVEAFFIRTIAPAGSSAKPTCSPSA
jgi:hypothetical protein